MAMIGMIARPLKSVTSPNTGVGTGNAAMQASFPKSNLDNNDYGRVARTTSGAPGVYGFYFDLGATPPAVDVVAVLWHNLRSTDNIKIQVGNTPDEAWQTAPIYNSQVGAPITGVSKRDEPAPGKFLRTLSATYTARYWVIILEVLGTALPSNYVQASRVVFGRKALFAIGAQKAEMSAVDLNQRIMIENGEERSSEDSLLIRPIASLDFRYAKETEIADFLGQYTLGLGVSKPLLICQDLTSPNLQDVLVFGRPEQVINHQSEVYDVWQFQARVRSFGP